MLTKTCLQGPNKLKNYRLRWLSKPLRLAKFESLWIKVCSIVAVFGIPGNISLLSLSFDKVFSMILLWFTIAECPSMLAVFPFYSVILRFWGTTDSSLWLPRVPEPVLCQSFRGLVISLFLIIFSFWCCLPESPLLTFHSEVSLGSWPQFFGFFTFFRLSFWLSFFLSFFPSERNPFLLGWSFSQPLSLIVLHYGFPEVPLPSFMNGYSKPSVSLLHHWVLRTHLSFVPCVFWHSLWAVLIPHQLCCTSQESWALGRL